MNLNTLIALLFDPHVALPLLGSVIAGVLIGGEREFQSKPAGLRTHTLVCFSSALMTLLALRMGEWVAILPEGTQIVSDMARMPHAILTGIGFLCAGVIFRDGLTVQGLTTAASLWMTAAIGIAFGTGMLELATIATAMTLSVLVVFRLARQLALPQAEFSLEITVAADATFHGSALRSLLETQGARMYSPVIQFDRERGTKRLTVMAKSARRDFDLDRLAELLSAETVILKAIITPIEVDTGGM